MLETLYRGLNSLVSLITRRRHQSVEFTFRTRDSSVNEIAQILLDSNTLEVLSLTNFQDPGGAVRVVIEYATTLNTHRVLVERIQSLPDFVGFTILETNVIQFISRQKRTQKKDRSTWPENDHHAGWTKRRRRL